MDTKTPQEGQILIAIRVPTTTSGVVFELGDKKAQALVAHKEMDRISAWAAAKATTGSSQLFRTTIISLNRCNLTTIEWIFGLSSVFGAVVIVVGLVGKATRRFRAFTGKITRDFEQEISYLTRASTSVPARSDLGVWVLIKLNRLQDQAAFFRNIACTCSVFGAGASLASLNECSPIGKIICAAAIVFFGSLTIASLTFAQLFLNFAETFSNRFSDLWLDHIKKRVDRLPETELDRRGRAATYLGLAS